MAKKTYPWTDEDYHALVKAAKELNARPLDLLAVLHSESGLDPTSIAYVKGEPWARGLNQITPTNAKPMKISTSEWESISSMTPAQNLPYVVRSFRAAVGDRVYKDVGELYQVNFAPATLKGGSEDDRVLYSAPSSGYRENKPLDVDGKGFITVGDLRKRVQRDANYIRFVNAANRLKELYPGLEGPVFGEGSAPGSTPTWAYWLAGGAIALTGGVVAWKFGAFEKIRDSKLYGKIERRFRKIGAKMSSSTKRLKARTA